MRKPIFFFVALLSSVCLSLTGHAQQRGFGRPDPIAAAEENVTLSFDPSLPIEPTMVNEIARSKDVAGAAASDLTGKPVRLELLGGSEQSWVAEGTEHTYSAGVQLARRARSTPGQLYLTVRAYIRGSSDGAEAEKYARLVLSRLDKVLAELSRREYERKREQLEKNVEQARDNFKLARERLESTQEKLRGESSPLSEAVLQELVTDLKKQQQALELELAGMTGRADALQREIVKTAEQTKKDPGGDEVFKNLRRVWEIRTTQLAQIRQLHEQGTVPATEVAKAEEQVALAQVELAQAQRAALRPLVDQVDKLTNELALIGVNRAEIEAKLKYVTLRLEQNLEALQEDARAKPLRQQLDKQMSAVTNLQAQADHSASELRQLVASFRPSRVEVFELAPKVEKPADAEETKP